MENPSSRGMVEISGVGLSGLRDLYGLGLGYRAFRSLPSAPVQP